MWMNLLAVLRNSLRVTPDHFKLALPPSDAKRLFARYVELIEVETTSYCNRTCSFCPNHFLDRLSEKFIMPEPTWQAILSGLREVDYNGTFVWSRYAEALSERRIIERIREVRRAAPKSRIGINSNGDFLDAEYLAELEEAGLDRLWIDIYIPDEETYDLEVAKNYHEKFIKRIKRSYSICATSIELSTKIESAKTEIFAHARNVAAMKAMDLSDRGGLIQIARETIRDAPCYAPYKHLVIDWDGSIVVCCQLRSDSPSHQEGVVGKVGFDGVGLIDAYIRLAEWRKALRAYGRKNGPCATCNVSEYDSTPLARKLSSFLTDDKSTLAQLLNNSVRPMLGKRARP
jgi:hypothetical protein